MYSKEELLDIIRPVEDPDLGFSVVDMGLIYDAKQNEDGSVFIEMTLTSPSCPMGPIIGEHVKRTVQLANGVTDVQLKWTFSPKWDPNTMASDEVKWELGIYD